MEWRKYTIVISPLTIIIALLLSIFGYFEFGGVAGVIALFGFTLTIVLISFVGMIPFIGLPIYILATIMWTNPYWYNISPLHRNWLTILIWIIGLINSVMLYIEKTEWAMEKFG